MKFNEDKPIYIQIADWMGEKIIKGEWSEGGRIMSVREVAMLLQVNPNTAMRAYESLQNDGIIFNKRGIGFFVDAGACEKIVKNERDRFVSEILPGIFGRMELLGITPGELQEQYEKYKKSK